jgi:phosphate transport system permease protein
MTQPDATLAAVPEPTPPIILYFGPTEETSRGRFGDVLLRLCSTLSASAVLLMMAGLIVVLTIAAMPSIRTFGWKFLIGSEWRPNELPGQPKKGPDGKLMLDEDGDVITETIPPAFGALPVIYGTVMSSAIALLIAVPVSMGAAIFLVRIAPKHIAPAVSFLVEFLAAIPSIAYGIWGVFVLSPFLQSDVEPFLRDSVGRLQGFKWLFYQTVTVSGHTVQHPLALTGRDLFAGSLVLAIMVIPIITAVSRDILKSVPRAQVEGTVALGATWWESSKEMLKFSRSGLFGAVMLGLARAAGETMAVTMVIGNNNQIRASLFAPAQTMSSLLANEFAEASTNVHRAALSEVALVLLVMSLIFNVVARYLFVGKQSRTAAAH